MKYMDHHVMEKKTITQHSKIDFPSLKTVVWPFFIFFYIHLSLFKYVTGAITKKKFVFLFFSFYSGQSFFMFFCVELVVSSIFFHSMMNRQFFSVGLISHHTITQKQTSKTNISQIFFVCLYINRAKDK